MRGKVAVFGILTGVLVLLSAGAGAAMAADVEFTAVSYDCWGRVKIYYDSNTPPGPLPRAFALDITVDSGATITAITNYKEGVSVSGDKGYGIFPGSIDINEAGEVNDVGTPVADPCKLPSDTLPGLGTGGITIEMGSLYVGSANAPDPCGLLCKIKVDSDCNLTIAENAGRGKVTMEGGGQATTNLPITIPTIFCPCGCPPDVDGDVDIDLADYYAIQGNLAYADYLLSGGAGTSYIIPEGDATVGHLFNCLMDTDIDNDIDLTDYYTCQGMLAYADYLLSGGAGTSYIIPAGDAIVGHLWPCP